MRGRPKQDRVLEHFVGVRLNDLDNDKLESLCEDSDVDRSEIIRRALRYYYLANKGRQN